MTVVSSKDNHFLSCPYGGMKSPRGRSTVCRNWGPAIRSWIISRPVRKVSAAVAGVAAPNQHLRSCPYRGVIQPRGRRTIGRYSSEDLRRSVVTIPGARETVWCNTTPNKHLSAGPYRRMCPAERRKPRSLNMGPSISCRIVTTPIIRP